MKIKGDLAFLLKTHNNEFVRTIFENSLINFPFLFSGISSKNVANNSNSHIYIYVQKVYQWNSTEYKDVTTFSFLAPKKHQTFSYSPIIWFFDVTMHIGRTCAQTFLTNSPQFNGFTFKYTNFVRNNIFWQYLQRNDLIRNIFFF